MPGTVALMVAQGVSPACATMRITMRAKYDFAYSKAERGRYYKRLLKQGANLVVLDRDVAKEFPDSASVNKALRSLLTGKGPRRRSSG